MGFFDSLFGKQTNSSKKKESKLSYHDCIEYMKGALYYRDYENALHHCDLAIKHDEQNSEPYLYKGDILVQQGNLNGAVAEWDKALSLSYGKLEYKEFGEEAKKRKLNYLATLLKINSNIKP